MDREPKKFITRVLEFTAMFALAMFLLRLGVAYLKEIRWILLIIVTVSCIAVVGYRVWRGNVR